MATDTTVIGQCAVCGTGVITDEPSTGGGPDGEPLRHSGCRDLTPREGLTIAEDALRAIADPGCGIVLAEDGYCSIDTSAAARIAEGTLKRLRAVNWA